MTAVTYTSPFPSIRKQDQSSQPFQTTKIQGENKEEAMKTPPTQSESVPERHFKKGRASITPSASSPYIAHP